MFEEFLNKEVKVPYNDGEQLKVARGKLIEVDDHFLKITGRLGTLILNKNSVVKVSEGKVEES